MPQKNLSRKILLVILLVSAVLGLGLYFLGAQTELKPKAEVAREGEFGVVSVVVNNLKIPWDIAFLPGGDILVTERGGKLILLSGEGGIKKEILIPDVAHTGEGGLLGIALHPDFEENNYVYLYHTTAVEGGLSNRVVRYVFRESELSEPKVIISRIPGAMFHDGGRIEFGPDGFLYVSTGDARNPQAAQDIDSLAGKILRFGDDGSIPADNPFGNAVWSFGHRNPQGLAWDDEGRLWSSEHGPSGWVWPNCCQDEINLIEKGKNYGWPESVGDKIQPGTEAPVLHSGKETWAPASLSYLEGSLFFGGLRGEALYEAVLQENRIVSLKEHFKGEFGRIRTVRKGPDGTLYITTSNQDGRGRPLPGAMIKL